MPGAKASFFLTGTTTPTDTYSDDELTTPHTNPVIADAAGVFDAIYLDSGTDYKFTLTDASDNLLYTVDPIDSPNAPFVYAGSFNLVGNGSTDDATAIQNALDSTRGAKVVFPKSGTYAFESALAVPAGLDVDFNGSTLKKTVTDATDAYQIVLGVGATIRNVTFSLPTGISVKRFVDGTAGGARLINVKVTSVDQNNNLGSSERSAIDMGGDDWVVDYIEVENFDRALIFEDGNDWRASNIKISAAAANLAVRNCQRFALTNYRCHTKSANAADSPGHDGMLIEDCIDGQFSNLGIRDVGEHGIYVSASANRLAFSNVHISSVGKTLWKCSGGASSGQMQHISVNGLMLGDASVGSAPGSNEEGVLVEYADYLTITGLSIHGISSKPFRGVFIGIGCTNINISGEIRDANSHGVVVTDKNVTSGVATATALTNITLDNLDILGAGGHGLFFDIGDASTTVGGIKARNLYVGAPTGDGVRLDMVGGNVTGAILIEGSVRNPGGVVYNNVNSVADEELNVRLRNSQSREIVTGTVTLSVHSPHSVLNSAGGAVTATLPDGVEIGQRKTITMSEASNPSTVSVTNHTTSSPEVFTFNATSDRLVLSWDGTTWWTESNVGVAT